MFYLFLPSKHTQQESLVTWTFADLSSWIQYVLHLSNFPIAHIGSDTQHSNINTMCIATVQYYTCGRALPSQITFCPSSPPKSSRRRCPWATTNFIPLNQWCSPLCSQVAGTQDNRSHWQDTHATNTFQHYSSNTEHSLTTTLSPLPV